MRNADRRRRRGHALAVALVALSLAGCNDDGRTLAPTSSTTSGTAATSTSADEAIVGMRITSPDLVEGELVDPRITCDGENVPPLLVLSGVPPSAAELAVAVVDLDADGYVHWLVAGLPPTTAQLGPAEVPAGAVLGRTDSGVEGWDGPCPPEGDEPHRYEVRLYAAAEPIGLAPGVDGRDAIEVIERAAIDVARLTVRYGREG